MKTQLVLWTVVAAAIFALIVPVASAEMMFDPPWERGGPATTFQAFEFNVDLWDADPSTLDNDFYVPGVDRPPHVSAWRAFPEQGVPGPLGQDVQVWHIMDSDVGGIDIYVPNDPRPNDEKLILVQITSDQPPGLPETNPHGSVVDYADPYPLDNGFATYASLITIPFNPPEEWIYFTLPPGTNISEVVVDTICIPEPATIVSLLSLFAVGIGVLVRRRF